MKRACVLALAFGLVACGGGGRDPLEDSPAAVYEPGVGGRGTIIRTGVDPNAAFSAGMDMKAKGDCTGAIARLRPVANMGPGYENAQTALGECLARPGAQTEATADLYEGMTWLRRAADAGWPEAQARLAQLHALGPATVRNGEEAAFWLALYDTNTGKSRIGFTMPDPSSLAAIRAALTVADRAAGEKRAAQWQRKVWLPPTPQTQSDPRAQGRRDLEPGR